MNPFSLIYAFNLWLIVLTSILLAQPSLAILPFYSSDLTLEETRMVSEKFRSEFNEIRKYSVLDHKTMETMLADQGFDINDRCRHNYCAVTLGQLLSVDDVVLGNVGMIDKTYTIDVKIINITSGSVLKDISARHTVKQPELVKKIIPKLVKELISTNTATVRVFKKRRRTAIPVTILTLGTAALAVPAYFLYIKYANQEPETRDIEVQW